MTKVIVLGKEDTYKNPIEFKKYLNRFLQIESSESKPHMFSNIELIRLHYTDELDLMFAYNEDRDLGCLFLGHFNDGVV